MSIDLERQQIEAQYEANAIGGVKFACAGFPLELEDPLTGVSNVPAVRLTIRSGEANQVSIGAPDNNITRNVGLAIFQIYTEGGKGVVQVNGIANTIMDMFRGQKLGTIRCKSPYPSAPEGEEPYEKLNVIVPYERDAFNA